MAQFDHSGKARLSSASFTPAAASHTNGDVVGGAATFSDVGDAGSLVQIVGWRMSIADATIETTAWTLHLFNAAPTVIADDAVFDVSVADRPRVTGKLFAREIGELFDAARVDGRVYLIGQRGLQVLTRRLDGVEETVDVGSRTLISAMGRHLVTADSGSLQVVGLSPNTAAARIASMVDDVFRQGVVVRLARTMR